MRGSNTLFADIFPTNSPAKSRRGRSETIDTDRNLCLISRYWFIGSETGLRYELLVKAIAKHFWLTETTITNILQLNHHILVQIRKGKPTKVELKKKWPHLNWETPDIKDYL